MHKKSSLRRACPNSGFSLISVIIAIAVLAILAGALGPMIFRQAMRAKEQKTLLEMDTLKVALLDFFEDTGRFPTEAEGLTVLINDPGLSQWQGPYLPGDPVATLAEFTKDVFGHDYIIDMNPVSDPAGTTELLLASSGINQSFEAGSLNGTWTLNDSGDDLIVLVDSDPANRKKILLATNEMQVISKGAQEYFHDHAAFPTTFAMLEGSYLDGSFGGGAFIDPWSGNYTLTVDNSAHPPTMIIMSHGPNQADNSGSVDDIALHVDSVGPGRESTHYMLNIIQRLVNTNSSTDLTGDWDDDREDFNLETAFAHDGWGNLYEEAMTTRTILSGGPDADYFTAADNIPTGVIPDDTSSILPWDLFGTYTIGDIVSHNGSNWECLQSHTCHGDPNWAPGIAHSLWKAA